MRFALKELLHEKKKYILIELLLILLIFMVLFLSGLAEGLGRAVVSGIDNMDADQFVISDSAEQVITVSELPDQALEDVRARMDAEVAGLDIQRMYLQKPGEEEKINVTYFAIEPGSFLTPEILEGEGLSASGSGDQIVLDDDYMTMGIGLGDVVRDSSTGIEFKVAGFVKDQMYGHTSVAFISTDSYVKIRTELNPHYQHRYHAIAVKGDAGNLDIKGTELVSKADVITSVPSYKAENMTINMIVWVLVIVSAVIIGIFYYILTLQKRKQFGIMKAVGLSMKELAANVVSQVLIVAVFAAVIANVLTFAMRAMLPQTMPFYLEGKSAALVTAAFILISVLSSLLSIITISRIDPVQAIGGNDE